MTSTKCLTSGLDVELSKLRFERLFCPYQIIRGDDELYSLMSRHEEVDNVRDELLIDNCRTQFDPVLGEEVTTPDVHANSRVRTLVPAGGM